MRIQLTVDGFSLNHDFTTCRKIRRIPLQACTVWKLLQIYLGISSCPHWVSWNIKHRNDKFHFQSDAVLSFEHLVKA